MAGAAETIDLIAESKADNGQDGFNAILPRDLLSLFIAPPVIGDAYFEDSYSGPQLSDLRGNFGFEAEAVAFDLDAIEDALAEDFVADFHVGEVEVGEHVAEHRKHAVAEGVPE